MGRVLVLIQVAALRAASQAHAPRSHGMKQLNEGGEYERRRGRPSKGASSASPMSLCYLLAEIRKEILVEPPAHFVEKRASRESTREGRSPTVTGSWTGGSWLTSMRRAWCGWCLTFTTGGFI